MTEKKKTKAPAKKKPAKTAKAAKARKKAPAKTPKTKRPAQKKAPPLHWLVRPQTIRKLWIGGIAMLAALVAMETGIKSYSTFGLDGTFGFYAWYGFAVCVAMVIAAKGLGVFLKREDTYYDGD